MPVMTGWEAVVAAMKAEGVPYVFGLPGDPRHLYDALAAVEPEGGPRPFGVRFETSGAFLAMAYARVIHARCVTTSRRRIAATPTPRLATIADPNTTRSTNSSVPP